MIKLDVTSDLNYNEKTLKATVSSLYPVLQEEILDLEIIRRTLSLDGVKAKYKMTLALSLSPEKEEGMLKMKKRVSPYGIREYKAKEARFPTSPVIVGAGPAGLFAALALAESGAKPIILERGLAVDERIKKVKLFESLGVLDTECNVQFGEGGAGTYSDGKLKVGKMDDFKYRILKELVRGGADAEICYSDTAHLGTDRLPSIVKALREKIESLGGVFLFGARFTAFKIRDSRIVSVVYTKDGAENEIPTDTVLFGIGHSARDTFFYLHSIGVKMESKPFGIGVRIEHPREYINALIYKGHKDEGLQTASYHLVTHLKNNRSVYSFCMCPGGTVVAATSHEGAVVTNGMSEYNRDADNSNSALLVSVSPADFGTDPLSGFIYQENIEKRAFSVSCDYKAPAVRLDDFISGKYGTSFASVKPSYTRGTVKSSFDSVLPDFVISSLREGIRDFDAWLPGFYLPDATLTGAETRSTSPVRILRNEKFESVSLSGLYPIGEGAGYAGGIVSSAYDGIRAANEIIEKNQ